jgi:hypothetical protein
MQGYVTWSSPAGYAVEHKPMLCLAQPANTPPGMARHATECMPMLCPTIPPCDGRDHPASLFLLIAVLRSQNYLFQLRLSKGFGSGSRSGSNSSFVTTCYHRSHIKKWIFHVFCEKNMDLIHMLDPIQYELLFIFTTLTDLEPEPKLRYSGSGQKFRLLAASAPAPAPQHCLIE